MGKTKEKNYNRQSFTQWIIVSVILFVYFLLVLISYSNEMKRSAAEAARSDFAYHVKAIAADFASDIYSVDQTARTTAAAVAAHDGEVLSEHIYDVLQKVVDSSSAIYGYISDASGNAVDIKGNTLNVWDNPDFAQAMTGIQIISDIQELEGGSNMIGFYAPVAEKGTIIGVICLQYPAEQFTTKPVQSDYDGYTTYALMKNDGTIVNVTGGSRVVDEGTVIFDVMTEVKENSREQELRKLRQCIENNKDGQALVSIEGEKWFVNCAMIGINNWYAVELHTGKYYDRASMRMYAPTKNVLVRLFVALFLFFGAVIVLNILNKTLYNRSAQELQNKADHDLLTGLYNKMATEKHIQEHLDTEGKDEPAMLCVLDIDNFKKINDTMGHGYH